MNTTDIQFALRGRLGRMAQFMGCFPSDYLLHFKVPSLRKRDIVFIINTLSSTSGVKMGHWFTIVIGKSPQEFVYVFDSLGIGIRTLCENLILFLRRNNMSYLEFGKSVQKRDSSLCAFFALYFTHMTTKYGLCKAVWALNKNMSLVNLSLNDNFVLKYYLNNLNTRDCNYVWYYTKPELSIDVCKMLKKNKKKKK